MGVGQGRGSTVPSQPPWDNAAQQAMRERHRFGREQASQIGRGPLPLGLAVLDKVVLAL